MDERHGNGNSTLKNKALVELELCGKKHVVFSNEVELKKIKLRIIKMQSCDFAFDGDKIQYTVKVCNESGVNLYNLCFKDFLGNSLDYERGSFCVDGKDECPDIEGSTISYIIPEIRAYGDKTITFKVKVD